MNEQWWQHFKRKLRRNWSGTLVLLFSGLVILMVIISGLFSPWVAPRDPHEQNLHQRLQPPSMLSEVEHPYILGTDSLGRCLLSRIIYGARISLLIGVIVVFVRGGLGSLLGMIAGYFGGVADDIIMRIADIQLTLPFLLVAIAVLSFLGPGFWNLVLVLGLTGWVGFGRVMRSQVLSIRQRDYVTAGKAAGGTVPHILRRHILPNSFTAILVMGTLSVASVILQESSLSFLGIGLPAGIPTWGRMISEGRTYVAQAWWYPVLPGVAIFLTVLSINLLGDWLRDVLDPRLRGTQ